MQQKDDISNDMEKMHLSSKSINSNKEEKSNKKNKKPVTYAAQRTIGQGSFGIVYQALVLESKEIVAIKVLQDRRFKNRELQIMQTLNHPDIVELKHCFMSRGERRDEVYLNLVMEYIPGSLYRAIRRYAKAKVRMNRLLVKVYMYQLW